MSLAQKAKELRMEQKKSDAILFQMLPTSVAIKLKQTRQVLSIVYVYIISKESFCFRFLPSFLNQLRFIFPILLDLLKLLAIAHHSKFVHFSIRSIKFSMLALNVMMSIKLKQLVMHTW